MQLSEGGAERTHIRNPKAHPDENSSVPRSDAGHKRLFSLAQDSVHRRPVLLQLCRAWKSPGTGGKTQRMGFITSHAIDSPVVVWAVSGAEVINKFSK